jgi:hypothetical protein
MQVYVNKKLNYMNSNNHFVLNMLNQAIISHLSMACKYYFNEKFKLFAVCRWILIFLSREIC